MLPKSSQQNRILTALIGTFAVALILQGCGGGDSGGTAATQGQTTTTTSGSGSSGGNAASGPGVSGPMSGGGGGPIGMPGMGAAPGGQATAVASAKPKNTSPAPNFRADPLRPWWDTTPVPPPVLSYVDPVRIAITNSAAEEKPAGVEIQEVPTRRVAGILTGNGVYALIDDFNGKAEVVKPGQVLDDGYRVASINANSVVLKKEIDNRTYTQVVPLTDAGSTTFSGPAMGPGGGGRMGMPGSGGRMGMPGMPGSGGGRGRGVAD
jgi:hypothetical protein